MGIKGQYTNMGFIALEKYGMLALGGNTVDFSVIAGGDVEIAGRIEGNVPYVFGAGVKINRRTPAGGGASLVLAGVDRTVGVMFEAIDLAV